MPSLERTMSRPDEASATFLRGDDGLDPARFAGLVCALAEVFAEAGARPGDRIALLASKSTMTVAALFAALRGGLIAVPVDVASPTRRVERILADCEPVLVVVDAEAVERHPAVVHGAAQIATAHVAVPDAVRLPEPADVEVSAAGELFPSGRDGREPAYLIYTSGTTGEPKGVCVSRDALDAFLRAAIERAEYDRSTVFLSFFPLHFDPVLMELLVPWAVGGELVLFGRMGMINDLVGALRTHGVTDFSCTPNVISMLVSRFSSYTAESQPTLRSVWFGGERPKPADIRTFQSRAPDVRLYNGYGPTECTVACSLGRVPEPTAGQEGDPPSIGTPMPGTEFRLVDGAGATIDADDVSGHLLIGGDQVMIGYWSTSAEDDPMVELDGRRYYPSGDLVHRTAGQYFFDDRLSGLLKIRGFRVHPAEVERALEQYETVAKAVVVASADGMSLEALVEADESRLDVAALQRELHEAVPSYMVPRQIEVVERLPRTVSGKIDTAAVTARLQAAPR